ncbi:MAG: hypothetical protein AB7H48_11980, partial [Parachlamydiales bacterium]
IMSVGFQCNFYLNYNPAALSQLGVDGGQGVENRAGQVSINTVPAVHEYVKQVFFDANAARTKGDDVGKFAGLGISHGINCVQELSQYFNGSANFITLCGHGGPGFQGLGSGSTETNYRKGYDICVDQLADIEGTITDMHRFLGAGNQPCPWPVPVLFLAGCEVGNDHDGTKLLKQLSAKMHNVLVVASEDPLTYRKCSTDVKIHKLVKGKPSQMPIEFKFALNGRRISMDNLDVCTGHDPSLLEHELTVYCK